MKTYNKVAINHLDNIEKKLRAFKPHTSDGFEARAVLVELLNTLYYITSERYSSSVDEEPECPHGDDCCQNEACSGPGNPPIEAITSEFYSSRTIADGLANVWEMGKKHGYQSKVKLSNNSVYQELLTKYNTQCLKIKEFEKIKKAAIGVYDAFAIVARGKITTGDEEYQSLVSLSDVLDDCFHGVKSDDKR